MYPMSLAMISAVLFLLGGALAVGALLRRKAGKRAVLAAVFAALCLCVAVGTAVGSASMKHQFGSSAVSDEKTGIVYTAHTDKGAVEMLYKDNTTASRKHNPNGSTTEYDASGNIVYEKNIFGVEVWYERLNDGSEYQVRKTWYEYDNNGNIKFERDSTNNIRCLYFYDASGSTVDSVHISPNDVCEWNPDGQLIRCTTSEQNTTPDCQYSFEYDSYGKLTRMDCHRKNPFKPNQAYTYTQRYQYDSSGNLAYSSKNYVPSRTIENWYKDGKLIRTFSEDNWLSLYEYDDYGNVIRYLFSSIDDVDKYQDFHETTYTHTYDDAGNLIHTIVAEETNAKNGYDEIFEYDEHGNIIHAYLKSGEYFYKYEYASAPAGRILSKTTKTKID